MIISQIRHHDTGHSAVLAHLVARQYLEPAEHPRNPGRAAISPDSALTTAPVNMPWPGCSFIIFDYALDLLAARHDPIPYTTWARAIAYAEHKHGATSLSLGALPAQVDDIDGAQGLLPTRCGLPISQIAGAARRRLDALPWSADHRTCRDLARNPPADARV